MMNTGTGSLPNNPGCRRCPLWEGVKSVCIPMGSWNPELEPRPQILVVGEAPGAEEDAQDKNFVGRAGTLLKKALSMAELDPCDVAVANVVKCRPPENRTPTAEECKTCAEYLNYEVMDLDPKTVVLLGRTAYQWACGWRRKTYSVGEHRGLLSTADLRPELQGRRVILTLHPAYVLRNPLALSYLVKDLSSIHCPLLNGYNPVPLPATYTVLDLETNQLYPWAPDSRVLCVGTQRVLNGVVEEVTVRPTWDPGCAIPTVVGHNIKFDLRWLREMPRRLQDTKIYAHLLDENRLSLSLSALCRTELGIPDWKVNRKHMEDLSIDELYKYNAQDVSNTHALYCKLYRELDEAGLMKLCDFEHDVLRCFLDMELTGMQVDVGALHRVDADLQDRMLRLRKLMQEEAGKPVNPMSTKQLQKYLFGERGYKPVRITATGLSVDDATISALRARHDDPFLEYLHEFRLASKEWTAFVHPLFRWLDNKQRVHPDYNTTGTVTGRVSCSDPAIQQAPRGGVSKYKQVFTSRYGNKGAILCADYSQLELRVGAWYSSDPAMRKVFLDGGDIHEATRAYIFGGEPQPGQREVAKRVNFGIFYGAGPSTLARTAGVSVAQATRYREQWFRAFPEVKVWIDGVKETLREHWVLETPLGRLRTFTLAGLSPKDEAHAEAQAVNFPIQSLAADLTKLAMLDVQAALRGTGACLIGQVHDSLLVDCPKEALDSVRYVVSEVMRSPSTSRFGFTFDVPLEVECKVGASWYEVDTGGEG